MDSIFGSLDHSYVFFSSDKGTEFGYSRHSDKPLNKDILKIYKKYNLKTYILKKGHKATIVERYNGTLKRRLERYFTHHRTKNWLGILEQFTFNINNSINKTIGQTPASVTLENAWKVREILYEDERDDKPCYFQPGDIVRVAKKKRNYAKGYERKYELIKLNSN